MPTETAGIETCIVIVNWNGKEILQKCLTSLFKNTDTSDCKVIVVDNASSDGSVERVKRSYPQAELIQNTVNTGFSKANNQAIRYALKNGAKYILLLNNDVEITERNWLEELKVVMESNSKIGIVGCKLLFPDGKLQHAGGVVDLRVPYNRGEYQTDYGQYNRVECVDYVTGAALMIKASVIRDIGLIDEGFTPLYYEDTDWCVRAKFYGYTVVYTSKPTLIHHCGASSNKLGDVKRFYAKRSLVRFVLLNYQVKNILKWAALYESREVLRCLLTKSNYGKLPLKLRADAASCLRFYFRIWLPSLRNLTDIIAKRQQRHSRGIKLRV